MRSKAAVAKALKDKGIPFPEEDSYSAMMHRLESWGEGKGYLFRRIKTRFYAQQNLPAEIPFGVVIFVPNSQFARQIMKTGAMFPMGRDFYKPNVHMLIDIPQEKEYVVPKTEKKSAPKKKKEKKVSKNDGGTKSNS